MVHKATTTLLKCSKAPEIWIQNRIVRIWKLCGKLEILSFCTHYPLHPPLSLTPPPAFPFLLHFFLTPSFIISEVHLSLVTVSSVTELQCKEGGGGGLFSSSSGAAITAPQASFPPAHHVVTPTQRQSRRLQQQQQQQQQHV